MVKLVGRFWGPRKIPARKKTYCHAHDIPLLAHKEQATAEAELQSLMDRLKTHKLEIRRCEACGKLHVYKEEDA